MVRILLADDHIVVRRGLITLFESRRDFEVCAEAADGRHAVELARQHKPDVAILDIGMPLLNGVEATRQIREFAPATEILIFTLHDSEDLIREVLAAGARGCILKSEADEQIVKAVEALARHRPYLSRQVSEMLFDTLATGADGAKNEISTNLGRLTAREREVVQLVAEGNSSKEVARQLGVSVKTIESHRSASMRKIGIHSTVELVRYAIRNKLVQP